MKGALFHSVCVHNIKLYIKLIEELFETSFIFHEYNLLQLQSILD